MFLSGLKLKSLSIGHALPIKYNLCVLKEKLPTKQKLDNTNMCEQAEQASFEIFRYFPNAKIVFLSIIFFDLQYINVVGTLLVDNFFLVYCILYVTSGKATGI